MNTDTQKPSEHAIRAANEWLNSEASLEFEDAELARVIDQHAIAPAVAEATKKLQQELEQEFYTAHAVGSSFAKELAEARREIDRLKANIGCAREQGSTQFCAEVLGRDKRIAELEQRIVKQNETIDRLNQCEADTQRIDSLNRAGFDLTESRGRWCVMDYINEKAHYGKTIREAIDATFGEEWASKDR